jgi:hypothetical protein
MSQRHIPRDGVQAAETTVTDEKWAQAETAHERFKALVETKPWAKARYDAVLAEINSR